MTRIHGRGLVLLGLWLGAGCVAREPAMSGEGSPRQEPAAVSDFYELHVTIPQERPPGP